MLSVTAQLKEVGRSRITLEQTVLRGEEVMAVGEVHLVCVGAASFKPVSVPVVLSKHWKI
jgi:acyl-CoA thioester hydrolase